MILSPQSKIVSFTRIYGFKNADNVIIWYLYISKPSLGEVIKLGKNVVINNRCKLSSKELVKSKGFGFTVHTELVVK